MRLLALWAALLVTLTLAGRALAQPAAALDVLRDKGAISDDDRLQIRRWAAETVNTMLTNRDPDRRGMVAARLTLVREAMPASGPRTAFQQAVAEEAVRVLAEAEPKAISQDARVNLIMAVSDLRALEGVPLLRAELEKGPYAATRYVAAKGLADVAPAVLEKVMPRVEADVSESFAKALGEDLPGPMILQMFNIFSVFEHEKAHDVLAQAVIKVAMTRSASDPVIAQALGTAIKALEKAYGREVRPEAKAQLMMGYATLCVWVMPPAADPNLLASLNASLEKLTGEKVGFNANEDGVMQKLALMEWVEKLVRIKRIPKRPALPPAIEAAVKEVAGK